VRCFGFGWDLVSAVAAGFVGRGKFGNGLYNGFSGFNGFNGWMLRFEGRGSREESWKGEKTRKASMGE
jgi:hypothetical protein